MTNDIRVHTRKSRQLRRQQDARAAELQMRLDALLAQEGPVTNDDALHLLSQVIAYVRTGEAKLRAMLPRPPSQSPIRVAAPRRPHRRARSRARAPTALAEPSEPRDATRRVDKARPRLRKPGARQVLPRRGRARSVVSVSTPHPRGQSRARGSQARGEGDVMAVAYRTTGLQAARYLERKRGGAARCRALAPLAAGLLATAHCYADALGALLGIESRAWQRVEAELSRRGEP